MSNWGADFSLTMRQSAFDRLASADRELLAAALHRRVRLLEPRQDIVRDGEAPRYLSVIMEGWGQRYKQLADGRRQILSFLLAGDLCHTNIAQAKPMDHSLATVTRVRLAEIPREECLKLMEASPRIAEFFWTSELVSGAIQREWTTNIGQRTAYERIAHLFCELFVRLRAIHKTSGRSCDFPLTQSEVAEATGLTQVHVNRTIQELRRDRLVEIRSKRLEIFDLRCLMEVAMFQPNYLGVDAAGLHLD